MLAVGVEGDEVLRARLRAGVLDAGLQRAALAEVDGVPHEVRAGGLICAAEPSLLPSSTQTTFGNVRSTSRTTSPITVASL